MYKSQCTAWWIYKNELFYKFVTIFYGDVNND